MSRLDLSLCAARTHYVNGEPMFGDIPEGLEQIQLGFGCFWGAERILWKLDGVHVTSVGYSGGHTPKPDYRLVCTGKTGHAEMCHVVYDPKVISFDEILKVFFEHHDPTQGDRQGNDVGPQYRSAIFTYSVADPSRRSCAARQSFITQRKIIISNIWPRIRKAIACMGRRAFSARCPNPPKVNLRLN